MFHRRGRFPRACTNPRAAPLTPPPLSAVVAPTLRDFTVWLAVRDWWMFLDVRSPPRRRWCHYLHRLIEMVEIIKLPIFASGTRWFFKILKSNFTVCCWCYFVIMPILGVLHWHKFISIIISKKVHSATLPYMALQVSTIFKQRLYILVIFSSI